MHVGSSEQTPPPQRSRAEFDRPRSKVAFATTVPDPSPVSSSPPDVGLGSSEVQTPGALGRLGTRDHAGPQVLNLDSRIPIQVAIV
eukprot:6257735-Pyramimonas_sp.AAC.1